MTLLYFYINYASALLPNLETINYITAISLINNLKFTKPFLANNGVKKTIKITISTLYQNIRHLGLYVIPIITI